MVALYSKRWSVAKGWYWKHERDCIEGTAFSWLKVFQQDEPEIDFILSIKKPK